MFNYNNSKEKCLIDYQDLFRKKHKTKMKVDTGANGNILPLKFY